MRKAIFLRVIDILQTNFLIDLKVFRAYDRIREDLGLNSHEIQMLVWYLENEYNLYIPDQELKKVKSLKDLVSCIDIHLQNTVLYPLYLAEAV